MAEDWIGSIKPKKEGVFSKEAEKNNMTTLAYANKVIKNLKGKTNGDKIKIRKLRQAVFAKNAIKVSKNK